MYNQPKKKKKLLTQIIVSSSFIRAMNAADNVDRMRPELLGRK
jgi:hypothetical protein